MTLNGLKILVTGGAGFIGSHIVRDLLQNGASVRVLDNFSSGSMENLAQIKHEIEIIEGDILNQDSLLKAARGVDAISHQAAQLEIIKCIEEPIEDLRTNTEGTLNVFEAAKRLGVPKVIYASSACVYGQAQYTPQDENHPTLPNWPYGISKLATEHYARLYHEYYQIQSAGLRYGIVYGPREWFGRVLTVFLKRALEKQPPIVWGGTQERDFIFVEDVVRLHRLWLEKDVSGSHVFNVSTASGTSIKDLANLVCRLFDLPEPVFEDVPMGETSELVSGRIRLPAELQTMILDNAKATQQLGWTPLVQLKDGLIQEMNWLINNQHRWQQMHY